MRSLLPRALRRLLVRGLGLGYLGAPSPRASRRVLAANSIAAHGGFRCTDMSRRSEIIYHVYAQCYCGIAPLVRTAPAPPDPRRKNASAGRAVRAGAKRDRAFRAGDKYLGYVYQNKDLGTARQGFFFCRAVFFFF
jgi:hypothetical protein